MSSNTLTADNGVISGASGIKYNGGNDGTLQLQTTTAGGTATTALTIDNSQNVGIGTSSPTNNLTIGNGGGGNNLGVSLSRGATTNFYEAYDGTKTMIVGTDASNAYVKLGSLSSSPVAIVQGNGNAIYIDTSKNVGIGTNSPTGISGYTALKINNATNGAILDLAQGDAYKGRLVATSSSFVFETSGSIPILFSPTGSEKARIDSSGNLLVGTASVISGARVSILNVNAGQGGMGIGNTGGTSASTCISFRNSNGEVGFIQTSGSATTFSTSSDYRLKEDISPMTDALSVVQALKPVTYKWKADGSGGQGFIAHELQAVVPDAVVGEKDAVDSDGNPKYQGIDTSFLVATLTAAIQELKAINDTQAQAITNLTERLAALEAKQ